MNHKKVVIIDYGVGNTQSVFNAISKLDCRVRISDRLADIRNADALILPGVGAFDEAMKNFDQRDLRTVLESEVIAGGKPILGICVGMQMLSEYSEENGHHSGLGWIPGSVRKIVSPSGYSVPHVGWNDVAVHMEAPLFARARSSFHFYFDHSYHFQCEKKYVGAFCSYGIEIVAAVQKENIFGVQFHPEKSQLSGLRLLKSFLVSGGATC